MLWRLAFVDGGRHVQAEDGQPATGNHGDALGSNHGTLICCIRNKNGVSGPRREHACYWRDSLLKGGIEGDGLEPHEAADTDEHDQGSREEVGEGCGSNIARGGRVRMAVLGEPCSAEADDGHANA